MLKLIQSVWFAPTLLVFVFLLASAEKELTIEQWLRRRAPWVIACIGLMLAHNEAMWRFSQKIAWEGTHYPTPGFGEQVSDCLPYFLLLFAGYRSRLWRQWVVLAAALLLCGALVFDIFSREAGEDSEDAMVGGLALQYFIAIVSAFWCLLCSVVSPKNKPPE